MQTQSVEKDSSVGLARIGIPVFPVRADKTPLVKGGYKAATTDAQTIEQWWSRWPEALVAVPTGIASCLWALDVDPEGEDWAIEHSALLMAAGRVHYTQRGKHYLFTHTPGIRNSQSRIASGIDVRGDGGYIVWWPAQGLHSLGEVEDIVAAPDPLLDIVRPTHSLSEPLTGPHVCGVTPQNDSEIGDAQALYSQKKIGAPSGTLDLFNQRTPRRPYATNNPKAGMRRMAPEQAKLYSDIQINPRPVRFWLPFDIDTSDAALAQQQAGLPEPAWIAENPTNGHAHIVWGIEAPVVLSDPNKPKPFRLLAAIENAYKAVLGADCSYTGVLTKNPFSHCWRTYWGDHGVYSLAELAQYVDLDKHRPHRGQNVEEKGLGRNVTLFDFLRERSYKLIRGYWDQDTYMPFLFACLEVAESRNADFPEPLPHFEVANTVKSVSAWTWEHFSKAQFQAVQSHRGRKGGVASGATRKNASQERRERLMPSILEMIGQGHSQQVIADTLGIAQKTVSNWVRSQ